MTAVKPYPRTPEDKARQLGARLACDAFNALGSLDAKLCQTIADAFGNAIAELVRSVSWEAAAARWLETWPAAKGFYEQQVYGRPWGRPLSPEAAAALAAGLESAKRGEIAPLEIPQDDDEPPADWQPSAEDLQRAREARPWDPDAHMGGAKEEAEGKAFLEGPEMRCYFCKKHRSLSHREAVGHDVDDAGGRRWYCSRECGAR